jgi:hypothetical protein
MPGPRATTRGLVRHGLLTSWAVLAHQGNSTAHTVPARLITSYIPVHLTDATLLSLSLADGGPSRLRRQFSSPFFLSMKQKSSSTSRGKVLKRKGKKYPTSRGKEPAKKQDSVHVVLGGHVGRPTLAICS